MQLDQLQIEYGRLKPHYLELEQKLEEEKRINATRERELIEAKNKQLEMLNAEVERFNK